MAIFKYIIIAIFIEQISCRQISENDRLRLRLKNPNEESSMLDESEERGFLDKQGIEDSDHFTNLNSNIKIKHDKSESKDVFYEYYDNEDSIRSDDLEEGREFQGLKFGEVLNVISLLQHELAIEKIIEVKNSNIGNHLFISYDRLLILVEQDRKLNNVPRVFYNTFFPTVIRCLSTLEKGVIDRILIPSMDKMLKLSFKGNYFGSSLGIPSYYLEKDSPVSNLYEDYNILVEEFELENNIENRKLAKEYAIVIEYFINIVRTYLHRNLKSDFAKYIIEKIYEIIPMINDAKDPRGRSIKRDINISSFLENLYKDFMKTWKVNLGEKVTEWNMGNEYIKFVKNFGVPGSWAEKFPVLDEEL